MSTEGGAYGAGRSSGSFDPLVYIRKPEVILRFCAMVFSIVVFGCIADQAKHGSVCVYNYNMDACNFGIAIGVISFVVLIGFLVADAFFDLLSNIQQRKYIVIADICFSCAWGFMWLVCFCFLTDNWRRSYYQYRKAPAEAALAFSFFCLAIFVALSVLAILRLRQGITEDFSMPTAAQPSTGATAVVPPANASTVYSVDDARFSPHPFMPPSTGKSASGIGEAPAY
jgi:MFS family permease